MSDVLVPLTSPVFMIGLEDSETIDLHNKYSQLIKAYESVVEQRNEERKESRRQINAIQVASERLVAMQTSRGGSRMSARDEAELEMKVEQLEAKVKLLESGIDLSRKANEELEADLGTALEDGVRYRDSLSKMIEIRERELGYRAQEEALALSGGGIKAAAAEVTKLKRELDRAGQLLEKEKAESKLLSNQVAELSAGHRAVHEDASMLRAQINELERAQREGERQRREAEEVAEAKAAKERASMLKKVANLEEEVARLGEFQAESQSLRLELEQAREQAKVQTKRRESEGGGDVSERQSAMAKIHDLDTELRQTRDELREAKEEIRRLEALVDSLRAEESRLVAFNDAIKASNVALKGSNDGMKKEKEVWAAERERLLEDLRGLETRNKELDMGSSSSRLASGRPPRPDGSRNAGSESSGSEPVSARGNEGAQRAVDTPAEAPAQPQAPLASPRGNVPSFPASPRAAVPPASPRAGSLASPRPSPKASPRTTVASPRSNPLSMSAFGGASTAAGSVATPAANIPGWERGPPPETPELDPEDWRLSIQQYEAAPPNTIADFVLVNKRASTVNAIAIDALLRRHKTSVTRIDLSYNYLRNSGVISLAYLFRSLPNLSHLDLGDNHIGDTGAAAVAESTITSTSLVTLALGGNRISDAGISAIANGMPSSMSTLNCNFNCVGDEGATALSRSIATGKTGLTCLYLSGNSIGAAGIKALAGVIDGKAKLKQMYLRGNPMDDECKAVLDTLAAQNPNLVLFV